MDKVRKCRHKAIRIVLYDVLYYLGEKIASN